MGFGLLSVVISVAIVLLRTVCDATPVLTLTGTSDFKSGDNLELSCTVNEPVDLCSVSFYQNMIETIWINNPTTCESYNLIPDDNRTYIVMCDRSYRNFTIIKIGLNDSDDKAVWFCRMISKAGGSCHVANNSCTSQSIILKLQVDTSGGLSVDTSGGLSDATPVLTLTGNSEFTSGGILQLSCSVNMDVDLLSVSFYRNMIETIWINNPTACTFFNLIPDDNSTYSIKCDTSNKTYTMIKYGLKVSDDNTVWFCRMVSKAGGNGSCPVTNKSCTSASISLKLKVPTPSPPSNNCCTWKTPDTMENTNQTTLIVAGVLFSLAACLFVATLVLFIYSRKGICSGVSNLQADTPGSETQCHYEDVNATSSTTPEYEELSNGSEKQPGSAKYLYTNTMHTSTM